MVKKAIKKIWANLVMLVISIIIFIYVLLKAF